jgi:hypothetical protein
MSNEEYLQSIGLNEGDKNYQRALDALNGYGDNRWWLSDDPRTRAYYQIMEPLQLTMSFDQFWQDVEILLGRGVYNIEFANNGKLQQEAQLAWQR